MRVGGALQAGGRRLQRRLFRAARPQAPPGGARLLCCATAGSPVWVRPPPSAAAFVTRRRPTSAAAAGAARGASVEEEAEEEEEEGAAAARASLSAFQACCKLHTTTLERDYVVPWQTRTASRSTGSGVLIERRDGVSVVLTAAHVVADATFLQVQLAGQPDKVTARVLSVCHETDLALVGVPPETFDGVEPLTVAGADVLPSLRDKVFVLGFPAGGDELSSAQPRLRCPLSVPAHAASAVTQGVVSRIEVITYSHSHSRALAITVDAAVNSGNSGGPVVSEASGEIVGIAFQGYAGSDIENQGHMVPSPLIRRFLDATAAGKPCGLPSLGCFLQTLQSPALRSRLHMAPSHSGLLVTSVEHGGCCAGLLQVGDVLLEADGHRVANDGTVLCLGRRLALAAVLHRRVFGDVLPLRVLRAGAELTVVPTLGRSPGLVPRGVYDAAPPYFLMAGLLFQPLSLEYIQTWGEVEKAPPHLQAAYYDGLVTPARTEVVLLTQVLADEVNVGYSGDSHGMDTVLSLNGTPVGSMRALVTAAVQQLAAGCEYVELQTARGDLRQLVVLRAAEIEAANQRIRTRYLVPAFASPHFADVVDVASGTAAAAAAAAAR